jgi:hypothetical protein
MQPKSTEINEVHQKKSIERANAAQIAAYIAAKCSLYRTKTRRRPGEKKKEL